MERYLWKSLLSLNIILSGDTIFHYLKINIVFLIFLRAFVVKKIAQQ